MSLIRISHPDLDGLAKTEVTADVTAADGTLTATNANPFSANWYLVLEAYNSSKAEIVRVSSSSPSGTTINLDSSNKPAFGHGKGASVTHIPYNQVAIEYSTDFETNWDTGNYTTLSAASDASTWTALATVDLQPSQEATVYDDQSNTRRSYRTRFYNSQANIYSAYSAPILPDGFEGESVGSIIERALDRTGQEIDNGHRGIINSQLLLNGFNSGLKEAHHARKRWSVNSNYDFTLSDITAGVYGYNLPVDIDTTDTKKSIYQVKVGNRSDLSYIDKAELDHRLEQAKLSTLTGSLTSGSSTITLADTSDFSDTGSFTVITGTTKDTVTYSANNRSTNTLTLSAASTEVTTTHASGTNIWQGASFGTPHSYTVYEDTLYLYPIPNTTVANRTIVLDYYKQVASVDDEGDYILFENSLVLEYYLCMYIEERLENYDKAAFYQQKFERQMANMLSQEYSGKKKKWKLDLNTGGYTPNKRGLRFDR